MADADGRLIPLVEDDQGEGIKDFLDEYREASKTFEEIMQEHMKKMMGG